MRHDLVKEQTTTYKGIVMKRISEPRFGSLRMKNHSFYRYFWRAEVGGFGVVDSTRAAVAAKVAVAKQWEEAGKPNGYGGLLAAYAEAGL